MGTSPSKAAATIDGGQRLSIETLNRLFREALQVWNPAELTQVVVPTKHPGVRDEKVMHQCGLSFPQWNIRVERELQPHDQDRVIFIPKDPNMPMAPLTPGELASVASIANKWIELGLTKFHIGMSSIKIVVTHPDIANGKVRAGLQDEYKDWNLSFDVPPRDGVSWTPTVTMTPK